MSKVYIVKPRSIDGQSPMSCAKSDHVKARDISISESMSAIGWKSTNSIQTSPGRVCNNSKSIYAEERAITAWLNCRPGRERLI